MQAQQNVVFYHETQPLFLFWSDDIVPEIPLSGNLLRILLSYRDSSIFKLIFAANA